MIALRSLARVGVAVCCTLGVLGGSPFGDLPAGRLGGPATVEADGADAFGFPVPGLDPADRRAFSVGNALFRDNWVVAPASTDGRDGLGPLFNANSCSACHPNDGRGRPPERAGDVGLGMVVFISPRDADGEPHAAYGAQLQDQGIPGTAPEVRITLAPRASRGEYRDGSPWELLSWVPGFAEPAYGPIDDVRASIRIGPQLIGAGLLEAVPDAAIVASEDPDDRDGDGISGRAHRLPGGEGIGRFGWKATQPNLEGQVAAALHEDMGLTSPRHPAESLTAPERAVIRAASGGSPEVDAAKVGRLAHYCRTLAVPAQRREAESTIDRGASLFLSLGCASCHSPALRTGDSSPIERLRNVVFHPYTDLLLHDMGDGLADDRRHGNASGREWRTPPLWGLGLLGTVNGHERLLHDGRARGFEEAILWHGGEALRAREGFNALDAADRSALTAFLRSL